MDDRPPAHLLSAALSFTLMEGCALESVATAERVPMPVRVGPVAPSGRGEEHPNQGRSSQASVDNGCSARSRSNGGASPTCRAGPTQMASSTLRCGPRPSARPTTLSVLKGSRRRRGGDRRSPPPRRCLGGRIPSMCSATRASPPLLPTAVRSKIRATIADRASYPGWCLSSRRERAAHVVAPRPNRRPSRGRAGPVRHLSSVVIYGQSGEFMPWWLGANTCSSDEPLIERPRLSRPSRAAKACALPRGCSPIHTHINPVGSITGPSCRLCLAWRGASNLLA